MEMAPEIVKLSDIKERISYVFGILTALSFSEDIDNLNYRCVSEARRSISAVLFDINKTLELD